MTMEEGAGEERERCREEVKGKGDVGAIKKGEGNSKLLCGWAEEKETENKKGRRLHEKKEGKQGLKEKEGKEMGKFF